MRAIFTIVTRNYVPFAAALFESATVCAPDAERYCVIVDGSALDASLFSMGVTIITLDELEIPSRKVFCFQYDAVEICTALKPFAMSRLLGRGYDVVTYLDPDIWMYRDLDEVMAAHAAGANMVLTPHLLAPMTAPGTPTELDIRRSGAYNLGFCSARKGDVTTKILSWWKEKLLRGCIVALERGVFVDQSWMDLVPGMFEGVLILRHAGYNVAYWNLTERPLAEAPDGGYSAANAALVFFHFSGINPEQPDHLSKYQDRVNLVSLRIARKIVQRYANRVQGLRLELSNAFCTSYGYGVFKNGEAIPNALRRRFLQDVDFAASIEQDPFSAHRLLRTFDETRRFDGLAPSIVMTSIWLSYPDVQRDQSIDSASGVATFYQWLAIEGHKYIATSVLHWHETVYREWQQARLISIETKEPVEDRAAKLAMQLYLRFLERIPDAEGAESYGKLCHSRSGYVQAWLGIAISAESRARSHLMSRIVSGMRDAIVTLIRW
jgi:hypothetical protein